LEAGVAADGAERRPSSTRAKTDWPKNANSIAATATLTRVSLFWHERNCVCSALNNNYLWVSTGNSCCKWPECK
jgi:hypothetical protein